MIRPLLIDHLYDQDCIPDTKFESEHGELWRNIINGEICFVPFDEDLELTTWCHIVYELKIDPPLHRDADYHVYVGWRETQYAESLKQEPKN